MGCDTVRPTIEVFRNGDYFQTWQLTDTATGAPIDITGQTLVLEVKNAAGEADPPIAAATVTIEASSFGFFDVLLHGSQFDAVAGVMETVRLAYDLRRTAAGIATIEASGVVLIKPGVS